jgi:hypothetical protein
VIKIDHISLKYLLEQRLTYSLQHKSLCKLLGLDYVVQYNKGMENKTVDALFRRPQDHLDEAEGIENSVSTVIEIILT